MPRPRVKRPEIQQPDDPSIRHIALTKGQIAIVDANLYSWLIQWNWYASWNTCGFYAYCRIRLLNGKVVAWGMHDAVLGIKPDSALQADHRNRYGLDNRVGNLRVADQWQQAHNRQKMAHSATSKFKGVSYSVRSRCWQMSITAKGVRTYLHYDVEEEAARAYDALAFNLHGQFAVLNFEYKDGEVPVMPPPRPLKKRGVKPGTHWKWAKEKRRHAFYHGEDSRPPIPPPQPSVEYM